VVAHADRTPSSTVRRSSRATSSRSGRSFSNAGQSISGSTSWGSARASRATSRRSRALGGVFVLEFREAVDLDLDRAFAVFRRSRHADDVADFDSGVGADAGLLEGGAGNDAVLVGDVENRRARRSV